MKSKLLWRNKNYDEASCLIFDINFKTIPDILKQDYLQLKAKISKSCRNLMKLMTATQKVTCWRNNLTNIRETVQINILKF